MAMDCKDGESPGPRRKDKTLPGHDIFCTPENSSFLSENPYKTLNSTQREIRLLKVHPDSGSGFVECELLPSAPIAELRGKYLALSYCAGNPHNTDIILVNGVKCNVFANLCHALTCTRHFWTTQPGDQDFLLWADQICINQADLSERSHQVGFMRDIYQSAKQTVICLSTSKNQGEGMKWLIETCGRNFDRRWTRPHSRTHAEQEKMIVTWEEIIESPWWNRAWVFQEFMVSANATFLSGHYQISWVKARLALEPYISPTYTPYEYDHPVNRRKIRKPVLSTNGHRSYIQGMFDQRYSPREDDDGRLYGARKDEDAAEKVWSMLETKAQWKDTAGLKFLLTRSRNSKASDDRDRVYSLLGLVDPGYEITPDYSASNTVCHVLTETTKSIILFENTLDIFSVLTAPPQARRPGLPSWVVDWTREGIAGPLNTEYLGAIKSAPAKGQAIASFRNTTHPETHQETTVMEVMGSYVTIAASAESESFSLRAPTNEVLEVWNLCGSPWDFFLRRESYGYRIIRWTSSYDRMSRRRWDSEWEDWDSVWASPARLPRPKAKEPRVITIF